MLYNKVSSENTRVRLINSSSGHAADDLCHVTENPSCLLTFNYKIKGDNPWRKLLQTDKIVLFFILSHMISHQ